MAQINNLLVMGQSNLLGSVTAPVCNFISHGNEFNFIPTEYDAPVYICYRGSSGTITGQNSDGNNKAISKYIFWNGRGSGNGGDRTTVEAKTFNATSDARLKENFQLFTPQKSILDLPIYKFDFINGNEKNQIGCKAQDLQEICPEIVHQSNDGYLTIQESKIVYLLIDEIKKLKNEIKNIKGGK